MQNPNRLRALAVGAVVLSSLNMASAAGTYSEARRIADNSVRLDKLHYYMQPKVRALIHDLEGHGYRPLIDVQVYRSPAQQAALVRKGVSKTYYSYHNVTGPKGQPESLAADIIDCRWFWQSEKPFWLKLTKAANSHNLDTGIAWGLSTAKRAQLKAALDKRNWNYSGPLGWDTAHVQVRGISLAQAKRGIRPKP